MVSTPALSTAIEPTVFQEVLRAPFFNLPDPVRMLHSVRGRAVYTGLVAVERGGNPLARLCAAIAGLPPAMADAPLRVEFLADARSETWRRAFGGHPMNSRLRCRKGLLVERLGPLQLRFLLHIADGAAISANLGVNPSLTITAQAERAMACWPGAGERDERPTQDEPYRRLDVAAARVPGVDLGLPAVRSA